MENSQIKKITSFTPTPVIHKYTLKLITYQEVEMCTPWQPLTTQLQNGKINVWGIVDPHESKEWVPFWIIPTGASPPIEAIFYLGTIQDESYVWHIFTGLAMNKRSQ